MLQLLSVTTSPPASLPSSGRGGPWWRRSWFISTRVSSCAESPSEAQSRSDTFPSSFNHCPAVSLTCKVSRIRFSSSSSLISSLISLLGHIKAISAAPLRPTEVRCTQSYLCWVFIWLNWSLRSFSSVRSCSTSAGDGLDGSLPGWGSEVARGVGCKTADRALGNSEDCFCTLLGTLIASLGSSGFSLGLNESACFSCCSSIPTVSCRN